MPRGSFRMKRLYMEGGYDLHLVLAEKAGAGATVVCDNIPVRLLL